MLNGFQAPMSKEDRVFGLSSLHLASVAPGAKFQRAWVITTAMARLIAAPGCFLAKLVMR